MASAITLVASNAAAASACLPPAAQLSWALFCAIQKYAAPAMNAAAMATIEKKSPPSSPAAAEAPNSIFDPAPLTFSPLPVRASSSSAVELGRAVLATAGIVLLPGAGSPRTLPSLAGSFKQCSMRPPRVVLPSAARPPLPPPTLAGYGGAALELTSAITSPHEDSSPRFPPAALSPRTLGPAVSHGFRPSRRDSLAKKFQDFNSRSHHARAGLTNRT
ncbi:hypothetical protein CLOM_g14185 [Closterium sp. NIES-68]|nr:hypothetical protein CLOM_g14185 [Closterium sp. NIES-68]GJP60337.1 hypothetical protein CLOP_g17541 [Closterium sp. NIES-67]